MFREINQCTDSMAKSGAGGSNNFLIVHEPPTSISHLLIADALEKPMLRS